MNYSRDSNFIHQQARRSVCTAWLVALLLLALPTALQAQFSYVITNGTITITGYTGPGGAVTIPASIDGLPVTDIGTDAFSGCTTLTNIAIPGSVTNIDGYAFSGCGLTTVTIPNSVTSMGGQAFSWCANLTSVLIPTSVTSIGFGVFEYCTGLASVTISNSVIGDMEFAFCTNLTSVTIGDSVTTIGDWAFDLCVSLTSVTIPKSVTNIGVEPFAWCTHLAAITVDTLNPAYSSVGGVLFNQPQTTLVEYPGGSAATSYTIPNSVTNIGKEAFWGCTNLTSVTIPNSVTAIPEGAFGVCYNLASVTLPDSVATIGWQAFELCTSLTSITIPDSVTSIEGYTFYSCSKLSNVTLGDSVTSIGEHAFDSCTSLTSITIPDSVTSIGDCGFSLCSALSGVYFLGNAPSLGINAFYSDDNATIFHFQGTAGWGPTFGGRPTAPWWIPPAIQNSPQTQTAEAGSTVDLWVKATCPWYYLWYLNNTNLISCSTNCDLELTPLQFSQSGAYTVVVSNVLGAVTSSPALLSVIAPVERRPVPGLKVTGEIASMVNVDYADSLSPTPNWTPLGSVSLTGPSQYYFDLTQPLPPRRFYRVWQTGTPNVLPCLSLLGIVPAITVTGSIGDSVRVDAINRFGPTDAWVALDTVTLTNTSELYFDTSAWGQPHRLYRLAQVP